ncbi:MAG: hypothetical protein GXX83_06255 [Gaiellales bacterium]|nr:hypothetical protein [Gaiellales bacterium]
MGGAGQISVLELLRPADTRTGTPERSGAPILKSKESMMEARFRGSRGQAFTLMPGDFRGTL